MTRTPRSGRSSWFRAIGGCGRSSVRSTAAGQWRRSTSSRRSIAGFSSSSTTSSSCGRWPALASSERCRRICCGRSSAADLPMPTSRASSGSTKSWSASGASRTTSSRRSSGSIRARQSSSHSRHTCMAPTSTLTNRSRRRRRRSSSWEAGPTASVRVSSSTTVAATPFLASARKASRRSW